MHHPVTKPQNFREVQSKKHLQINLQTTTDQIINVAHEKVEIIVFTSILLFFWRSVILPQRYSDYRPTTDYQEFP